MTVEQVDQAVHPEQLHLFLTGMNEAFLARSSDTIPYEEAPLSMLEQEGMAVYLAWEEQTVVGGFCVLSRQKEGVCIGKIAHVWTGIRHQGQGIARRMLTQYLEESQAQLLVLDVAHSYEPAVRLYRRMGFRTAGIYANRPGTYHFLHMTRPVAPYREPPVKRLTRLAGSYIRFYLLFHSDSTPNWIYRNIYRKWVQHRG